MRRLILIRHAKSAWDDPEQADHDRPLAPRGCEAAAWIGQTLRAEGWLPDAVLCSTAVRTRQTLDLAGITTGVTYAPQVYDLRDADFIDLIRAKGGPARVLALVGHNTAMERTAMLLAGDDADFGGYPTGALAVLDFDIGDWSELRKGTGRVEAFRRPPKG